MGSQILKRNLLSRVRCDARNNSQNVETMRGEMDFKEMWYIHATEYCSAPKRKAILTFAYVDEFCGRVLAAYTRP